MNRDGTLFFTRGGCVSYLRACLGARLLPQLFLYKPPNLLEGADRVGGQLSGDECPFSGVTKSGRVWKNLPESDARSVEHALGFVGLSMGCCYELTVRRSTWLLGA